MIDLYEQVLAARERLRGQAHVTPVMRSRTLDAAAGADVFCKCENLQRIGAFKFRGAYNAMSQLSGAEKSRGVLTYSSGNHAQAVALVGRLLDIRTTVIMPDNAPAIKREATAGYGARIIAYNAAERSREEIAAEVREQGDWVVIPPFDDYAIVAGQGTAALELLESHGAMDRFLVPCGGGGLLSGSAIAAKALCPDCKVIGVEPETADDATRSFRSGRLQSVSNPDTIADGTRTPSLGRITFGLVRQYVDDMVTVSEEAIVAAVRFLFYRMKLVVEPSGALGVAALLSGGFRDGGRVGVILSGGNIDGPTMTKILRE